MGRKLLPVAAALVVALSSMPADARRTVVDFAPDDPEMLYPIATYMDGYCDFDGAECTPIPLGYSVDFGDGLGPVNSVVVYGNGTLAFTNTTGDAYALVGHTDPSPTVAGGAISSASFDFVSNYSFSHGTTFSVGQTIDLQLYSCSSSNSCFIAMWDMTLFAQANGFKASVTYHKDGPFGGWLPGYDIPGGTGGGDQVPGGAGATYDFFVPATVTGLAPSTPAVPEPGTWALMIAGFAATGGLLRLRRRRGSTPSVGGNEAA